METLTNTLVADIKIALENAKPLLNDEQFSRLKADLLVSAENTLKGIALKEVRKLNEAIK